VVQEKVLSKVKNNRLKVFVIWLPMVGGDSREAALHARGLIGDRRASHFWDPRREMATAFGKLIGQSEGRRPRLAWDFYVVFDTSVKWKAAVPVPVDWMHQLDGVDPRRRLDGDKLRASVLNVLKAIPDTRNGLSGAAGPHRSGSRNSTLASPRRSVAGKCVENTPGGYDGVP
jgi:hypothetical protein